MTPPTVTEKGEETRTRILRAARDLFAEHGYRATSMTDILRAAGITKGGFYFHFRSKGELAVAVVEAGRREMDAEVAREVTGARAIDDVFAVIRGAFRICSRAEMSVMKRVCFELADETGSPAHIDAVPATWAANVAALLHEAKRQGDLAEGVDPDTAAVLLVSAYFGLLEMGPSLRGGAAAYQEEFIRMVRRELLHHE